MQALYLTGGRLQYRRDYPGPEAPPGEALIRLLAGGICATDLEVVKGYAGFEGVLGHEFVGVVEESPDPAWIGRRVVGGINAGCGVCAECLSAGPEHCPGRTVLGIINRQGVFADCFTLPLANLLPVPDEMPDELAVFVEPLAAALRIGEQIVVRPTARAAVVGPGRLGLLVGQVLALGGTEVTMLGRSAESLALPARLGMATGLVEEVGDKAYDLVVEATGNEAGLAHSMRLVRPRGTLVLKSTFEGRPAINLSPLVVDEVSVVGSRCGPFEPALRLLAKGGVQVRPLIDAEYPLSQGLAAFAHADRPSVRKVLLRP
jgi:threonine dehydrogenase-like Zn-dependent dehydrogenase